MNQEHDIVQRFKNASEWFGAGFYTCKSASREDIEQKLGIKFPQVYLDLVSRLAEQAVPSQDIIRASDDHSESSWPKHLVPFFQDGHGNAYCFDTRASSPDYPIVFLDHELTRDENIARTGETDASFTEWAKRYTRDEIPNEAPRALGKGFGIGCLIAIFVVVLLAAIGIGAIIHWIRQM